jgi:hypothetical protein
MLHRSYVRLCLVAVASVLLLSSFAATGQDTRQRGRKYKAPQPTARIEVTVLRDVTGKPIENAAVIFHLMGDKGNMELKSNEEGKSVIDVLPMGGAVRLQIIAKGFQTYGEDFKIDKAEIAIEVKLKRPGEQYSIYKDHGPADGAAKDQPPAADKDKPAAKPDPQPSPSQPQPK